jgi:hypothetical protein
MELKIEFAAKSKNDCRHLGAPRHSMQFAKPLAV